MSRERICKHSFCRLQSNSVSSPRVCRDLSPLPLCVQGPAVCTGVAVQSPHTAPSLRGLSVSMTVPGSLGSRFWCKARPAGLEGEMWVLTTLFNMIQNYKKQEEKDFLFSLGSAGLACLRAEITHCFVARIELHTKGNTWTHTFISHVLQALKIMKISLVWL